MLKGTILKKLHPRNYIWGTLSLPGTYWDGEIMDLDLESDAVMGWVLGVDHLRGMYVACGKNVNNLLPEKTVTD